ncbi:LppP/LprE family lipoprotein [Corynebacterium kroppenstedtii]|uniref:Putative secreted protein n=1 Tax=Corynebacterium kroppenstedtii (strain DSM 44385 / JCM 11950 / CIP 105744 / CCUG 35717) TaxID=645127 RepID=C4LGK1_CORK4|nr:LppP/LprE family lipoprotein [Corynebacterium kroppenstedtii]ACR16956.1 putative secreted protein [Corynebacterium kroppenstedtii DSM 44385]QRP09759.1 LppP/LprE family lipoprotein [Corynebacterium kroppenstedtii]
MKVSSSHVVKGIALLASVVVLAGCNQGGDNDNSQATDQPTSEVTKSSIATPSSENAAASEDSSSGAAESDEQDADSDNQTAAQQRKDQESGTDNIAAREYQDHAAEVPPPSSGEWDIDLSSFLENQPCAALSWAVLVPMKIVDGSPPTQTMLFHNGRFIKTVSQKTTYSPDVSRVDDSTINVNWKWSKPGDPLAEKTGRSFATFRWDDQSESVVMEGELPPD